jgi:hypothetical protein
MFAKPASPGAINGNSYPNSWPPRHSADGQRAILDAEVARRQIEPVLGQRDTERPSQVSRTATQLVIVDETTIRCAASGH